MSLAVELKAVETPEDFARFAELIREYVCWCTRRYADDTPFVQAAFGHQALHAELESLPQKYTSPTGRAYLALVDGRPVGCAAHRRFDDESCEMKRLFVLEDYRGLGLGQRLCNELIASAREAGYRQMLLDTGDRFSEAVELYRKHGFVDCDAFHNYPEEIGKHIRFMRRRL